MYTSASLPTKQSVRARIREYDKNGRQWFLRIYAYNCPTVYYYASYKNVLYDMKALYAASHEPKIPPAVFTSKVALRGLGKLGFKCLKVESVDTWLEGQRHLVEARIIGRNSTVAEKAKEHYGRTCMVCEFNFEDCYGALGKGYIECHHIDELSGRDGKSEPTELGQLAVLCANCHRMVHRQTPCLTLKELRAKLQISN